MIDIIKSIIENDKDAVILIQSDHSVRPNLFQFLFDKKGQLDENDLKYAKSIFNVIYYKGEYFDIEHLSGLDTLKKLLENM